MNDRSRGRALAGLILAGVLSWIPGNANSGATDPTLAIGSLVARPAGGASIAEVTGVFGFDDALQVQYPLNLVVYQGSAFVRFPIGSGAESGQFAGLADGLEVAEIASLEAAGSPESAAEILELDANRITVSLPPTFFDGTLTAVLYVELPSEGGFTSNFLSTTLAGTGGAP